MMFFCLQVPRNRVLVVQGSPIRMNIYVSDKFCLPLMSYFKSYFSHTPAQDIGPSRTLSERTTVPPRSRVDKLVYDRTTRPPIHGYVNCQSDHRAMTESIVKETGFRLFGECCAITRMRSCVVSPLECRTVTRNPQPWCELLRL